MPTSEPPIPEQKSTALNAFFTAARDGDAEALAAFLAKNPDWAQKNRANGWRAMEIAAVSGQADCIRALLPFCEPDRRPELENNTALQFAAGNAHLECVLALLPASDAQAANDKGGVPLMRAARMGSIECVRALLAASDPLAVDLEGRSALDFAFEDESWDCVDLLAASMSPAHARKAMETAPKNALPQCQALLEREAIAGALAISPIPDQEISLSAERDPERETVPPLAQPAISARTARRV